jgi:hypothetical protein
MYCRYGSRRLRFNYSSRSAHELKPYGCFLRDAAENKIEEAWIYSVPLFSLNIIYYKPELRKTLPNYLFFAPLGSALYLLKLIL